MKYGKIENNRVVHTISGLQPIGYIPYNKKWNRPSEYNLKFYATATNIPKVSVVLGEIHENWDFVLLPLESLKESIYSKLADLRQIKELAGFEYGGQIIPATKTAQAKIPQMPVNVPAFKVANGKFISIVNTQSMKDALIAHVQGCYLWENLEVDKVIDCNNYQKLSDYITNSPHMVEF